jgi:hypothetical protein
MNSGRGILESRTAGVVVGLGLLFVAVLSWLNITRSAVVPHDSILILGLLFSIFISASITCRSSFAGDRIVFGAITASLLLGVTRASVSLAPLTLQIIAVAKSLLWTTGAIVSLVCLARCFMPRRQ